MYVNHLAHLQPGHFQALLTCSRMLACVDFHLVIYVPLPLGPLITTNVLQLDFSFLYPQAMRFIPHPYLSTFTVY